ncbi:hypothetical protein RA29_20830 [Tateyamaria sp. ANG-S1]|nr:hypothetical protein RA29_20830 [Tateyamaria sp. ANG-S1]
MASDNVKGRTVRGILATIWLAGGGQMLRFASNLLLTRLLFPEAFGIMALVQVIIGGLVMFADAGLRGSVVQNPRGDEPAFLDTVWTVQILRGIALWLIISLLAVVFSRFFQQPQLIHILPVAGVTLVIQGLHSTKVLSAQRHLQLGRHASLTLASQMIGLIGTAFLAYFLQTVWALAIGMLIQPTIALLLYARYLEGHRNRLALERASLRDIFNLGKFLSISSIATYVMNQSDRAILGTAITVDLLGIYGLALALAQIPTTLTQRIAGSVLFPLYRMRHPLDDLRNQTNLFKVRRLLVLAGCSMLSLVALTGPWLVETLYDDRYKAAGGIAVLLAVALMPRMIMTGVMNSAVAKGNSFAMMAVNLSTAIVQLTILVALVPSFGIIGVSVAIGLAPVIVYPLVAYYSAQYKTWDGWGDLAFFVTSSTLTAYALWLHWNDIQTVVYLS